jgi:hypothetical protein
MKKKKNFLTWKIYLTPHTKSLSCFSLKTVIHLSDIGGNLESGGQESKPALCKAVFQPPNSNENKQNRFESKNKKKHQKKFPKKKQILAHPKKTSFRFLLNRFEPATARFRSSASASDRVVRSPYKSLLVFRKKNNWICFLFLVFLSLFLKKKLSRI